MMLKGYFEEIESVKFSAVMNAASGFRNFHNALAEDDTVRAIIFHMRQNPHDSSNVITRFLDLLDKNDNPEFAHPYDAALAGYLYILKDVSPQRALYVARHALKNQQLWWTKKLAEQVQRTVIKDVSFANESASITSHEYQVFSPLSTVKIVGGK